ncbi:hypothetical protein EIN_022820 [Entamoeba invadens IP1]|uniref:hypothetical protein n=1 Tax=Entamoeba invadens IP1 TaxID=370355 RepID=UPI0002C3E881|nr:hypothetical protein EIN_022820 [Entamoeba invadens IP1]ELP90643.1 hypothetical protein EIN_022820 [Entamoeba invadens IP1]|eukprot:XP_004257414.1 hypothetical protein EIN_022820 [Entamoeba invadens IP1]
MLSSTCKADNYNAFLESPYSGIKGFLGDFTIHIPFIKSLTLQHFLQTPPPSPSELIGLFPISQAIFNHISIVITTTPIINQYLLCLVPSKMNEQVFWYKYFEYLFNSEDKPTLLSELIEKRNSLKLLPKYVFLNGVYIDYSTNQKKQNQSIFPQVIELIASNQSFDLKTIYSDALCSTDLIPKSESVFNNTYDLLITIFCYLFKDFKDLYIPYVGNLVLLSLQLFNASETFVNIFNLIVAAHCDGSFYSSRFELELLTEFMFAAVVLQHPHIKQYNKSVVLDFIENSMKNFALPLLNSLELVQKRPIVEFLLQNGKVGFLRLFLYLFKESSNLDYTSVNSLTQSTAEQILLLHKNESSPFVSELLVFPMNQFLTHNHFISTLVFPPPEMLSQATPVVCASPSICCGSSNILNEKEFAEIVKFLPERIRMVSPEFLFCSSVDGLSLRTLYMKITFSSMLLFLCQRASHVFGVFVAEELVMKNDYYGNGETFVFTAKPFRRKFTQKEHTKNKFIIRSTPHALLFGGGKFVFYI